MTHLRYSYISSSIHVCRVSVPSVDGMVRSNPQLLQIKSLIIKGNIEGDPLKINQKLNMKVFLPVLFDQYLIHSYTPLRIQYTLQLYKPMLSINVVIFEPIIFIFKMLIFCIFTYDSKYFFNKLFLLYVWVWIDELYSRQDGKLTSTP